MAESVSDISLLLMAIRVPEYVAHIRKVPNSPRVKERTFTIATAIRHMDVSP
jgi:hypothetical protein